MISPYKVKGKAFMKLAVVTGGTRGIGAVISILLQENGLDVIATYNQDKITAETFSNSRKIPVF
jgi:acetoacetyl-CoA reductase